MGMSVLVHRGIAVPDHRLAECINHSNRGAACAVLLRCISAVCEYLRLHRSAAADCSQLVLASLLRGGGRLTHVFADLSVETSVENLRRMLLSIPLEVDDADVSSVVFDDLALDIWRAILRELHPSAPLPMSTVIVRSPRLEGHELEPNVLHFIFSEQHCVSVSKTAEGQALDAAIRQQTKVSTWISTST